MSESSVIPQGYKFAALSAKVSVEAKLPIRLNSNVSVHNDVPFEISDFWRKTLGDLGVEDLEAANVHIVVMEPAKDPSLVDGQNDELMKSVQLFYQALLLTGFLQVDDPPQIISGANPLGVPEVRQVGHTEHARFTNGAIAEPITAAKLLKALSLTSPMDDIPNSKSHARFLRSFNSFMDGLLASNVDERLHLFVRAIEGLILPDINNTLR